MAIVMIQHESALVTMSGGTDEGSVDPGNGDFGYHSVLSVIAMTILRVEKGGGLERLVCRRRIGGPYEGAVSGCCLHRTHWGHNLAHLDLLGWREERKEGEADLLDLGWFEVEPSKLSARGQTYTL